jgi:hypothetical protein
MLAIGCLKSNPKRKVIHPNLNAFMSQETSKNTLSVVDNCISNPQFLTSIRFCKPETMRSKTYKAARTINLTVSIAAFATSRFPVT